MDRPESNRPSWNFMTNPTSTEPQMNPPCVHSVIVRYAVNEIV